MTRLWSDTWIDADPADQDIALMMATRNLDTWFDWEGTISSSTQALLWPRRGVERAGVSESQSAALDDTEFGILLNSSTIPKFLYEACAEWARQLLVADRGADSDVETQGISSLSVASISLSFKGGVSAKPVPDSVVAMVSPYGTLRSKSGSGAVSIYRA
jgi:hypothetical protein